MSLFKGSGVAIVTPFDSNNNIDYKVFKELIEFQIENKTDAIIVAGTTGEASTLTDEEHLAIIEFVVKTVNKRIPVIAGTGSNDTHHGINLSKRAEKLGVDGLLQVTPYYNKTSQKGLYHHFKAIADSVKIPIILYTVPGRTNVNIEIDTLYELSKIPNIIGIKDATGNLAYSVDVINRCGLDFDLYSGNDDITTPILSIGGKGVISVIANILPKQTHDLVYSYLNNDIDKSRDLQIKYKKLIDALFIEPNPIMVKKALELMKYNSMNLRLPLYDADEKSTNILIRELREAGLL